jgi:glycosyltransferase involved in cell wall biosynthesis
VLLDFLYRWAHFVTTPIADVTSARPILVHSHLRWDFVWQRPQQLISRFACSRDVLFVEEPLFLDDVTKPVLEGSEPLPNVHRIIPRLPASYRDSESATHHVVRTLLLELVGTGGRLAHRFEAPIQWFYTPMPAPVMLGAFGERLVVYDCMDELAQFRFAPAELVQRERFLLARSDVVFAGGRSLAEAKSRFHDNVHFFGCGVDADHFSAASRDNTTVPEALAALPGPVLGYIGVIDERLDYALIAHMAEQLPNSSIAMVGPVVKVDPRDLPRRENIHWFGQQAYGDLPSYMRGFDVCLMPFALNKATEYINPTKTLEYMASGKPIVSTPVPDVVRNFTPIVAVAESAPEYVQAIRTSLERPDPARRAQSIQRARQSSWESITGEMTLLMEEAIATRQRRHQAEQVPGRITTRTERGVRRAP